MKAIRLRDLQPGQHAVVRALELQGSMRRRLCDIGMIEHTRLECLGVSPGGDPKAFLLRGAVIALRSADSGGILVELIED